MWTNIAKLVKLSSSINMRMFSHSLPTHFQCSFNHNFLYNDCIFFILLIPFYFLLHELPKHILSILLSKTNLFHILFSKRLLWQESSHVSVNCNVFIQFVICFLSLLVVAYAMQKKLLLRSQNYQSFLECLLGFLTFLENYPQIIQ